MSSLERSPLGWIILGLLAALVATNMTFLILRRTGGPLVGLVFYLALLVLTVRPGQPLHRLLLVGGLVGMAVQVVEAATLGWSAYPGLVAPNLVLPAALALSAWAADRALRPVAGDR